MATVISTFNTAADRRKAVGYEPFRILLPTKNLQVLFVVSPSAISDLSLICNLLKSNGQGAERN